MSAGNRASRSVGNPCEIFQFRGKRHVEVGSERENERVLWAHCAAEAASLDNRPAAGGYVGKKTSGFCGSSWGWHPYSMQCKALAASGDTL